MLSVCLKKAEFRRGCCTSSEKDVIDQVSFGTCDVESEESTWQSNPLASSLWMNRAGLENQVAAFILVQTQTIPTFMKVMRDGSLGVRP